MELNYSDLIYTPQEFQQSDWPKIPTRDAYGKELLQMGGEEEFANIVALDADLSGSTRTGWFGKEFPDRFFNIGIAEQDMVGIAAGLSLGGQIPFISTFAIFLTGRAWEPVRQSICYPNLNVKLVASHSGLTVGEDGASHQALEDITLMRVLPNMKVLAPADGSQTRAMVRYAARTPGPVYIRTSRPKSPIIYKEDYQYDPGQPDLLLPGQDVLIVTTGFLVQEALAAVELLAQEGYYPGLLNLHTIKPLPEEALGRIFADYKKIATFEEHSAYGGLGSAVAEYVSSHECKPVWVHGTREFGKSGSPKNLLKMYELDAPHIKSKVQEIFEQGR